MFVHHMWGSHRTPRRHFQYLNDKGFDCVTFDLLLGSEEQPTQWHADLKYLYKGIFYLWTRQIRAVLNSIEGPKIVYAFSGPSLSALWASQGRSDIKKVICDGGPFHNIYSNTKNFFRDVVGIKNKVLNKAFAFVGTALWGIQPLRKLHQVLSLWPKAIPILSIRGEADNIVSLESIQQVFAPHPNLNLTVLQLKHGKHLDGLRDFPEEYKACLQPFIKQGLTPTATS